MKQNQLLLLVAVAAVILALVVVNRDGEAPVAEPQTRALVPELQARLNDLDRVQVRGPQAASVTLNRDGEGWRVEEVGGYPVDVPRLRELLLTLARAERIEAKTARPEYYDRLGLQGLDSADSPTRRLTLARGDATELDLWIGNRRQGESFVRVDGEDQTWLVSGRLEASANPVDWLRPQITDIGRDRIRAIEVSPVEARAYQLSRQAEGDALALAEPPPETASLKPAVANRLAGALQDLRLRGVAPRETATAATPAHRLRFASFDGLVVEARLDKRESKHYLTLDFKAADGAEQSEALRVELDRLREQVQPWTFELSDYDGGSFALLRADLLEQAQAAEPAAEAPAD